MITKTSLNTLLTLGLFALLAFVLFLPVDALAQGVTGVQKGLTEQNTQLAKELTTVPRLIALACYVIGTFFAVRALFALRAYIEKPDDAPLTSVLGFAAIAALLIMLPYIIGVMQNTIGAENGSVKSSSQQFNDQGAL